MKMYRRNSNLKRIGALLLAVVIVFTTSDYSVYAKEDVTQEAVHDETAPVEESVNEDIKEVAEDDSQTPEQQDETLEEQSEESSGLSAEETDTEESTEQPEEAITEESAEQSEEIVESAENNSEKSTEEAVEEKAEEPSESQPFESSVSVDGVKITVTADAGVFPEGAKIKALKVTGAKEKEALEAVDEVRDSDKNVAASYTFDITVLDKDDNEIEPDNEKGSVKVAFKLEEAKNVNLDTAVYHVEEAEGTGDSLEATELTNIETSGAEVTATTDGFSLYTVEFTYDELQYVLAGDETVELSEILKTVKIKVTGNIEKVESSDDDLFTASLVNGKWYVTALRAFSSREWLKVTIDGIEYEIIVTDDNGGSGSGYCQVTKDNINGFKTDFTFTGSFKPTTSNAIFTDDNSKVSDSTTHKLNKGESTTVKFPSAYTYFDGSVYDVYVEVIARKNYTSTKWVCKVGNESDRSYVKLQPASNSCDFNYKVWLQSGDTIIKGIALVGGSCYTAQTEGARPYSDDGYIYTTNVGTTWNYDTTYEKWAPNDGNANKYNVYILGHGTDDEGKIWGGYYDSSSGQAEICLGYLSRELEIKVDTDVYKIQASDGYPIGKKGADYINGKKDTITGWTSNKKVNLEDGSSIDAGKKIPKDTLQYVIVEEGLELTAITTPSYTVSFDLNYAGAPTAPESITVFQGDTYGILPTPASAPANMHFDGWYTQATGGDKKVATDTVASAHTLYAHWAVNTCTVSFNPNATGITADPASEDLTQEQPYGTLPTLSGAPEGYSFDGWYTSATGGTQITSDSTVPTEDTYTLYAHWKANSYTLTFNPMSGSVSPTTQSVTYDAKYGDLPTPTRTGYTFTGWYTEETGGSKIESTTIYKTADNQTVYAHWTAKTCTVNFDAKGGFVNPSSNQVTFAAKYGELPTPTKTGYTFKGWYTEASAGSQVTKDSVVNIDSNHTLYAHWEDMGITVTMKDYTFGGEGLEAPTVSKTVTGATVKYYYTENNETTGGTEWNGELSSLALLHAGNYYMYAVITGTDGTCYTTANDSFKVEKADPTYTAPTPNEWTYDGTDKVLVTVSTVPVGGHIEYSLTAEGTYETTIPTKTDAGTYPVYYRIKGDENHNDITGLDPITGKINKADWDVTPPTDKASIYNGSMQDLIIHAIESSGGTVLYSLDNENFAATIPQGKNVGNYTVYYKVEGDNNHNEYTVQSITATISKNARTPVTVTMTGYKYGQITTLPVPKLSALPEENPEIVYYYYPKDHPEEEAVWDNITSKTLDAGDYVMIAKIAATDNYGPYTTQEVAFVVAKGEYVINPTPTATYTFGQLIKNMLPLGGKATAKDAESTEMTGTFAWKDYTVDSEGISQLEVMPHVSDSGTRKFKATFTPTGDFAKNYGPQECDCLITVTAKEANPDELNMKLVRDGGGYDVTEDMTGEVTDLVRDNQYDIDIRKVENKDKNGKVTDIDYIITYTFKGDYTGTIVKKVNMPVPEDNPQGEHPQSSILARVDRDDYVISEYNPKLEAPDYMAAKKIVDDDLKKAAEGAAESSPEYHFKEMLADPNKAGKVIYDANVFIEVTKPVESQGIFATDKPIAEEFIAENIKNVGEKIEYIDISMFTTYKLTDADDTSKVYKANKRQIHETEEFERITINIPEEMRIYPSNVERTFYIIRVHDGAAEILEDAVVANGKITFSTKLFSTYAICYSDVIKSSPTSGHGKKSSGDKHHGWFDWFNTEEEVAETPVENTVVETAVATPTAMAPAPVVETAGNVISPKTADTCEVIVFTMMLMAGIAVLLSSRKNKRHSE